MNETCQYVIRANDVVPYEQPPSLSGDEALKALSRQQFVN